MADKDMLVVNAAAASAADAFLMLGEQTAGNEQNISECPAVQDGLKRRRCDRGAPQKLRQERHPGAASESGRKPTTIPEQTGFRFC